MKGIVVKSTGSWYNVLDEEGKAWKARVRGKIRLQEADTSNPIAVGDRVLLQPDPQYPDTCSITDIEPRSNWVIRKSNKLSSRRQIIAANIDVAVMVAGLAAPRTSFGFIDRFLVCCEVFHIPAIIFLNKTDLLPAEGLELLNEVGDIYRNAGYIVISGSAATGQGVEELRQAIAGKTVLFAGHSGVGKSTLLNCMFPEAEARVGIISEAHEKGKHTTTFAEMHMFAGNTGIIDTPGIRDFGLVDILPKESGQYFPEFRPFLQQCKFNDCSHTNEPECAIKAAVEAGQIPMQRFYSYLSILQGEDVYS
ncbi:MAG: ribosome small subunit-dependent GTPase A [Sphingomonadales bacterium]